MKKKSSFKAEPLKLLILTAVVLLILFTNLYININPSLKTAEANFSSGKTINLNSRTQPEQLKRILSEGNYLTDPRDIDLITDSLSAKLTTAGSMDNVGVINKQSFFIAAPVEWTSNIGGKDFAG